MTNYFRPYDGDKPYIFVSYAHKNSEKVLKIINDLRDQKYLLWYDEGIPAGSDWPKNIADHMAACDSVLIFLSKEFYESDNCAMEAEEAEKQQKNIYRFRLDDTMENFPVLPESLVGTEDDYRKKRKIRQKFNWWIPGLVLAVAVLIGAIFSVNRITGGKTLDEIRAQQENTVDIVIADEVDTSSLGGLLTKNAPFTDRVTENYVRNRLNREEEDLPISCLLDLDEFMVCGSFFVDDPEQISFSPNGDARFNNWTVLRGPISDITAQSYMLNVRRMILSSQEITDISALSTLTGLEYLDISNNAISDISVLENMKNLQVLHLEHTAVESLDALGALPNLRYIYISSDMLPLKNNTNIPIRVVW